MKILFILLLSFNSMASTVELAQDLRVFIGSLNKIFGRDVRFNEVCVSVEPSNKVQNGVEFIEICEPVLKLFADLSPTPSRTALTIAAHEYAHLLVEREITVEAMNERIESVREASRYILSKLSNKRFEQLKLATTPIYDTPEKLIPFVLEIAEHENMDTLGVKLMFLANASPSSDGVKLIYERYFNNPYYLRFVEPRTEAVNVSITEGLNGWTNFRCIGSGYEVEGSNEMLKRTFNASIVSSFTQKCDNEEILNIFYQTLDTYFPIK